MKRTDYREIARSYDRARSMSEENLEMWLGLISEASRAGKGARVLDLGCGTGRFALPMAGRLGYQVTGADSSPDMLERARIKDTESTVRWDCQDATCLGYADALFDVVFMSHLLHHVESPEAVIAECHRILLPSGAVVIRYGAVEQIRGDVAHTLFPGVMAIDGARTPSVETTERWLTRAGFVDVASREVVQQTFSSGWQHLEAARAKATSAMTMISPGAFEQGMRSLEEHVRRNPDDPWLLFDRMTLTAGTRAGGPHWTAR